MFWSLKTLHKIYKVALTESQPADSGVKSHPVVKLVFITLSLIHHPTAASRREHKTLNCHKPKLPHLKTNLSPGDNPNGCFNWQARNQEAWMAGGRYVNPFDEHCCLVVCISSLTSSTHIHTHQKHIHCTSLHFSSLPHASTALCSLLVGQDAWCSAPEAVA